VKQSDQVTSIEAISKLVRSESDSGMAKGETAAEPSKVGIDPLGKAAELLKKAEV
jgi:hypothetical protein